ncbi:MAG TPA: acyltransferase [Caulobacteraceae bacterium]|nr:acyltransferase [Caulobacteraceae bacterium]
MTKTAERSARLHALDGWRAIAVLMVITAHLQTGGVSSESMMGTIGYGFLGVDYFFGISGFVIARGIMAEGNRPWVGGFYVRRFFRIVPPLALYLAVIAALSLSGAVSHHAIWSLRALTFTCNIHGADCGGWFGAHTWSLSVEEQFYLLAPLLISEVATTRALSTVFLCALGPIGAALLYFHHATWGQFVGDFSCIGVGVACAFYEAPLAKLAARMPSWTVPLAFVAAIALIYLPPGKIVSVLYIGLPFLILYALLVSAFSTGWLQTLLGRSPLTTIGSFSYGLYLWQQLATGSWPGDNIWQHLVAVAQPSPLPLPCTDGWNALSTASGVGWCRLPVHASRWQTPGSIRIGTTARRNRAFALAAGNCAGTSTARWTCSARTASPWLGDGGQSARLTP